MFGGSFWYSLSNYMGSSAGTFGEEVLSRNQHGNIGSISNKTVYLALSINAKGDEISQEWFLDGKSFQRGVLSKEYFEDFLTYCNTNKCIELGRAMINYSGNWQYIIGDCYSMRLYNRRIVC